MYTEQAEITGKRGENHAKECIVFSKRKNSSLGINKV
jgi:hypothetical protein